MFEKVHSFSFREHLIEEMEDLDNEVFLVPLTIHEKTWLKSLFQDRDAHLFLKEETLQKLEEVLQDIPPIHDHHIIEKFHIDVSHENHGILNVYRLVRTLILKKKGFCISYRTNDEAYHHDISGIPFRLEYLIHKKQWSVIWYLDGELIYTPLQRIETITLFEVDSDVYQVASIHFETIIKSEKLSAKLMINQKAFQKYSFLEEKQRILYALSGFEKELFYHQEKDEYEIQIYYRQTEVENLLQKIRLLGSKIIIKEPQSLKERMLATAERCLKRYNS